ncbi:3-hydroxyacyl-ACP dehydratase FabZ [Thiolapillus brandeum]|uniref:3-hydroxyacyl-[acyl-carrier-protein] dehydratase FabZ n=1 Tax=Thiolapillus brandeum TaxID=1076588 RepID=A0A7U6GI55_9GAMM|nr:3-hydroxyacyl-ACP dehydratase FabZ [Thiolapillus brandeum]BAO44089.1 3R-hydroxymyristoyl ACP dehydrase [Thiolapillus brandeum]
MENMDIGQIMQRLPHRYPFLLVDRVLECTPGEHLLAIKNVSMNEPFFQGHFPGKPVMPGVLLVEAMAQATCLLAMETEPSDQDITYLLAGVDKARFKRQVTPGDQLALEATLEKRKRGVWVFSARALVEGKVAASAEIMCTAREI